MAQELKDVVSTVITRLESDFNYIASLVLRDTEFETTLRRALHASFMEITSITYRMV